MGIGNNSDRENDEGSNKEKEPFSLPQVSDGNNEPLHNEVLENYASLRNILKQIIPILVITTAGSIFAGFVFSGMSEQLDLLPGLIVLIPAVMDTRGNIYGAFGSKISTGMHLGIINPKFERNSNLYNAIGVTVINSIIVSLMISALAYGILIMLSEESISIFALTAISLLAGIISGFILLLVVLFLGFFGYQKGIDPDNLLGPAVTITGDIFSILSLLLAADLIIGAI